MAWPPSRLISYILLLWLVLAAWLPCGHRVVADRLAEVRAATAAVQGHAFSETELRAALGRMSLDLGVNRYAPQIEYHSASDWRVRLVAEKEFGYASDVPLWYRVLTINFHRVRFPMIEVQAAAVAGYLSAVPPREA